MPSSASASRSHSLHARTRSTRSMPERKRAYLGRSRNQWGRETHPPCMHTLPGADTAERAVGQELRMDRADGLVVAEEEHRRHAAQGGEDRRRQMLLDHPHERDVGAKLPHGGPDPREREWIHDLQEGLRGGFVGAVGDEVGRPPGLVSGTARQQPCVVAGFPKSGPKRREIRLHAASLTKPVGDEQQAHPRPNDRPPAPARPQAARPRAPPRGF